ncbi:putative non-haem dioxygenase in morphine synthesis N-terminal [Lyophyllum shimeji]|uniref:Non-haem dioxygenase in morphine synthesis N-terminal n=1 Tax=Lyophyllum shimeji TaxID=47721 RepID=A0A9P3UQT6_LYOSH|nr:putative non-haem dioxygenase in morphine synthesis N-terminal [Lyophyllum shimeji]
MRTHGFFYAVNHGCTPEQTNRIFSIAHLAFDGVASRGRPMMAYRRRGSGSVNRHLHKRSHPEALRSFLPMIDDFARHDHYNILRPILGLLALGLKLPQDTLVDQHGYDARGQTSVRFMKYHPRSAEEAKTKNVWLKGRTDFGSITILWSQPVGGLGILSPDMEAGSTHRNRAVEYLRVYVCCL